MRVSHLDELFSLAHPRLLRLARLCGVPADSLDDVVQETYIAAWSHLDQLRAPDRIHAWLEGICRNQCRMYIRKQRNRALYDLPLSCLLTQVEQGEDTLDALLPDQHAPDPLEELDRQERLHLLERALATLPQEAREIFLLCDLAGQPQHEVAARLGISPQTLSVRRHRARQHLRRLLNGQLRASAEACEFPINLDPSSAWPTSHEWCPECGKQRLRGVLEQRPDGGTALRLRCPTCSAHDKHDMFFYAPPIGETLFKGRRTLGPALKALRKHAQNTLHPYLFAAFTTDTQVCLHCQQPVHANLQANDIPGSPARYYQITLSCPCGYSFTLWAGELACSCTTHPIVRQFFAQHPRWMAEPDLQVAYEGELVCCFRLTAATDGSCLTILAHSQTLQVLSAFIER